MTVSSTASIAVIWGRVVERLLPAGRGHVRPGAHSGGRGFGQGIRERGHTGYFGATWRALLNGKAHGGMSNGKAHAGTGVGAGGRRTPLQRLAGPQAAITSRTEV